MFRPPFLARVAAGAAVYALEETRRLPATAVRLPITAVSQLLQTSMHLQQFVTSLALKGDTVFDRLAPTEDQPEWATFDEDEDNAADPNATARASRFDLYTADEPEPETAKFHGATPVLAAVADEPVADEPATDRPQSTPSVEEVAEPEVATRYDYADMTLAQLRARLRMLTLDDLAALLDYEQRTRARAPFVTMLTNRIATVQAQ
ncbi:lipid droplet-associated protein [Nocardia callitridis]|uniref:Lipid droplet-associated protein n=1 Tax=Nocardia callitridis TaxID=648753 RepID=A0ABP9JRS5_9NOCA